jgi:4-amino-4-deoxy-L-arabinose transferase-like glycosyltransferase
MKSDEEARKQFFNYVLFALVFIFICRLVANYFIPLNDTTEARYAEIARKMLETGNWVTLQHEYGVPFWAKPPLSTWLSALSMRLFGINEFAARLPSLLLSLGVLGLIWDLARKQSGILAATIAVCVLSGTLYFFLDAGAVMTEPALIFSITLSLVAFWHALIKGKKVWSYVFFIGLGLGLLAKGPIAIILIGLPIFFWVLLRNEWMRLWQKLPWIKGFLLVCLIALPWYILAEIRTPGFLNYFIVGEHFHRFLTPGWSGDKYGSPHYAPKGMIWVYALAGLFPWTIVVFVWLAKQGKKISLLSRDDEGWLSYLLLCALSPLVFFTFAGNIIYPYVFPALPGFALLFSEIWCRSSSPLNRSLWIPKLSLMCGFCALVVTGLFALKPEWIAKTQKPVINAWISQHPAPGSSLIYWSNAGEFSAQFYAQGKVQFTHQTNDLCTLLSTGKEHYLAININEIDQLPAALAAKMSLVKTVMVKKNKISLFYVPIFMCLPNFE